MSYHHSVLSILSKDEFLPPKSPKIPILSSEVPTTSPKLLRISSKIPTISPKARKTTPLTTPSPPTIQVKKDGRKWTLMGIKVPEVKKMSFDLTPIKQALKIFSPKREYPKKNSYNRGA